MADLTPPSRFHDASLDGYRPQTETQAEALDKARSFVRLVRVRYRRPGWFRVFRRSTGLRGGLYLVGPVGTGKTHLLASIYHALTHPEDDSTPVPCAFTHSSALFRATETPQAYAEHIAARARVLCLDEVELDDPAGEIRLIGVLKALRDAEVTLAATSNAEPEKFVSAAFGRDRLERFISEEFERRYHVVMVGGTDFRQNLDKPGRAWIGPLETATPAMRTAFEKTEGKARWMDFHDLLHLTETTERQRLATRLATHDALFLNGIRITSTDDALRLLRVMDDLYTAPDPPTIYFTSETPPAEWFDTSAARGVVETGIATKFARTTSRLTALAEVQRVKGDNPHRRPPQHRE